MKDITEAVEYFIKCVNVSHLSIYIGGSMTLGQNIQTRQSFLKEDSDGWKALQFGDAVYKIELWINKTESQKTKPKHRQFPKVALKTTLRSLQTTKF